MTCESVAQVNHLINPHLAARVEFRLGFSSARLRGVGNQDYIAGGIISKDLMPFSQMLYKCKYMCLSTIDNFVTYTLT